MTNEEAIKHITTWLYAAPDLPPMKVVQALELAVNALRAGGTDTNVPTMPAGQPLTLDQLCKIEGKKVLIYRMKSTEPLEPGIVKMNGDVLGDNGTLAYHELYLLTWVAFSYPTAHIDREALKPCSRCRPQENSLDRFSGHEFLIDDAEIYFYDSEDGWEGEEIKFCPWCGRPLTEEAEVHCETLEKMVKEYQETIIPGYRKRAETAEETASDLCDDFTDFVTGGVHNAAPYCSNRRPECVDAHGWCDGDNRVCRGFAPKAEVGRKEE